MRKTLNFDQFLQEKNGETITVVIYGKAYRVPMAIPAIVPVMLARAEEDMDAAQASLLLTRALDLMLGRGSVDELCRKGMTSAQLSLLARKLFTAVTQGLSGEEEEAQELTDEDSRKTARGERKKKPACSGSGTPWRRTSCGTTASGSPSRSIP